MDVRLGDPAHAGRQQPHSPSARLGPRLDAQLAGRNGGPAGQTSGDLLKYFSSFNDHIIQDSDNFYSYKKPTISASNTAKSRSSAPRSPRPAPGRKSPRYPRRLLRFTSPVATPFPKIIWSTRAGSLPRAPRRRAFTPLECRCDFLQRTVPGAELDGHCSPAPVHALSRHSPPRRNRPRRLCRLRQHRTHSRLRRQGVIDVRCCLDWLESQGCNRLGIVGTSLGSCYAFIATAHDPRIQVAAFNHASTYFADVVWHGQSTRHIREGLETAIDLENLRNVWRAVSPMVYFDKFSRWPRRSLINLCEIRHDVLARILRAGSRGIQKA